MLQVTADYIESMILQYEAVAKPSLISDCRHNQIFSFSNSLTHDLWDFLAQWILYEADEEHLEHVNETVLLVDVLESFAFHVGL